MLGYEFPQIRHIGDVLPHIEGVEGFHVNEKDGGYTVVGYRIMGSDTFPLIDLEQATEAIRDMDCWHEHPYYATLHRYLIQRECRGLVFDSETGRLIGRRFHKFFNLGEREDIGDAPGFLEDSYMLEKVDGSMVSPVPLSGGMRWMTKGGITDVSMEAEVYIAGHENIQRMADVLNSIGVNPIFEWCSRKNRVVIDHPEDRLVLLAVRAKNCGSYWGRPAVSALATQFGVEVVTEYPVFTDACWKAHHRVNRIRQSEGTEGMVFVNAGHFLKVKSEWYTQLHKLKESTDREHVLVNIVLDEGLDDLMSMVDRDAQERIRAYASMFWNRVEGTIEHVLHNTVNRYSHLDRKGFAQSIADDNPLYKSMAFRAYGLGNDDAKRTALYNSLITVIRKRSTGATPWAILREQLKLPEYVRPF